MKVKKWWLWIALTTKLQRSGRVKTYFGGRTNKSLCLMVNRVGHEEVRGRMNGIALYWDKENYGGKKELW